MDTTKIAHTETTSKTATEAMGIVDRLFGAQIAFGNATRVAQADAESATLRAIASREGNVSALYGHTDLLKVARSAHRHVARVLARMGTGAAARELQRVDRPLATIDELEALYSVALEEATDADGMLWGDKPDERLRHAYVKSAKATILAGLLRVAKQLEMDVDASGREVGDG